MAKFNTPITLKSEDQSKYFKGLTKAEENQIFSQVDSLPISQYEKNLKADTLYKQMLDKKKHTQFVNDRLEATNEIYDKSLDSKDPVESKSLQSQGKFGQLADMVRNLMYEKEGMNLDNFKDEDVVTAFLKDNPDMVNQFDSFMNGEQTAESFASRNGFDYNQIDKAVDQVFGSNGTTASYMNQQGEGEWNDEFFGRLDTETLDQGASVKGFLKNLAKSTWNVVADVGNMVVNPFDTANALAKTAVGAGMNVLGIDDNTDDEGWLAEANQVADGLGEFLKERYGGKKEILNTLYSDPMGLVSDIASIATGGAGAVKSIAGGIAKGAAKVGLANTARTAGNVSKVAGKVMNIADKADPYTQAMKVYGKGGEKAVEYGTKGVNYVKENFNIDNFVGLDAKTKKNIQDNPYAAEAWEKAQNYIEENGLPDKSQRVSKDLMQGVVEEVQTEINKLKQQLGETSPEYKKLKESGAKVSFYDINNKINEILENAGVQISEKGALDFSKTAIKDTEASAIRRLYNWAKSTDEMDIAEYMRYRKFIDELGLWEDAKGTPGKNVLKQIREAGNEIAHEQVEPLKLLDKQFSERAAALDKVTEGIVYREKRKAGQIKDNINQILKNLDEPNRRMLSQRLQEILPGVEEKVRAINMLPKLIDNYYRHDHAADIMKTMGLSSIGGLIGSAGGGIVGGIAGTVGGYFLGKGFNKLKQSRWEKAMGKLSEAGQQKLSEISEKIQAKEDLTKFEENYVKAIGKQIEEGNFKENQVSSKTATNQEVFNDLAEAIADIGEDTTDADIKLIEQLLEENRKELSEGDYKTLKSVLEDQKSDWEIAKGEKEFMEGEGKRIINNEDAKAVKDFQSRILKIENEEKNIGTVAGKKVSKAVKDSQKRAWESKKEKLIEEIGEYYGLDQYEAANKYDELRDSANVNNVKYQVADEPITKDNSGKELSKGQQEYFKGSKVVDENGNLMRVYHGTNAKYTVYNKKELGSASGDLGFFGDGWYFATHKGEAGYYGRNVMEGYLDVKNPFYFSELDKIGDKSIRNSEFVTLRNLSKLDDSIGKIKYNGYSLKEIGSMVDDYLNDVKIEKLNDSVDNYGDEVTYWKVTHDGKSEIYTSVKGFSEDEMLAARLNEYMRDKFGYIKVSDILEDMTYESRFNKDTKSFSQILQDKGYDGIIVGDSASKADEIVVFNSNQFKNIDNLDPTKNEDIRFQKYGTAGEGEKGVNAIQGLNIRNFKNGKSVKELADNYGIKTHIVQSISTPEGQKAYGMYGDRVITLAKDLKESTVPHELLHATFDMVDQTKKNQILDGIKERLKVDDVQAEEWLADNFSEYYRTGKFDTKAIPTTLVGKIKQFFQQVKEFVDGTYAERKQIQNLFDDILEGKDLEGGKGTKSVFQSAGDIYSNNFKNWFGDWENDPKYASKFVDNTGEPLKMYHGTPEKGINIFDRSKIGSSTDSGVRGRGFYFTPDKDYATTYSKRNGKVGEVKEVYLDSKNPFIIESQADIDRFNEYYLKDTKNLLQDYMEGRKQGILRDLYDEGYENGTKALRDAGYDGVIIKKNGDITEGVVFEPNQIKSATDNIGTFDKNNPDIRYQLDDTVKERFFGKGDQQKSNLAKVKNMKPVSDLVGNEFDFTSPNELTNAVEKYYNDEFGGKVNRGGFGNIILSRSGIKSSIHHYNGKEKRAAFKAVPYIIKDGEQTNYIPNRKNRGYDTYVFSAPLNIGGRKYIGVVSVNKPVGKDNSYFYLHQVELEDLVN